MVEIVENMFWSVFELKKAINAGVLANKWAKDWARRDALSFERQPESSRSCRWFSLSPGQRAGVRGKGFNSRRDASSVERLLPPHPNPLPLASGTQHRPCVLRVRFFTFPA